MRYCQHNECDMPVFGTCKITKKGFCKKHQYLREDIDKRTIREKSLSKVKKISYKIKSYGLSVNGNIDGERQSLIQDLDFVFSRIVRLIGTDNNQQCQCYTCPTKRQWSFMQCGHFEKRSNTQVRWDFRNARPQCRYCNENLGGNLEVFAARLEQEQKGLPEQLQERAREPYKWSREELKQLLIDYRARLRVLESKFNS